MLKYEFDAKDPQYGEIFYVALSRTKTPMGEFIVTWEDGIEYVGIYPYPSKSFSEQQIRSLQRDILADFAKRVQN